MGAIALVGQAPSAALLGAQLLGMLPTAVVAAGTVRIQAIRTLA